MDNHSSNQRILDFDLHGIVGLRLLNPTADDAVSLTKQLGAMKASLMRAPDIVVHFKEQLSTRTLTYLGLNAAAFDDEGFYLLGRSSGQVEARIPFDRIGDRCEIQCKRGVGSVPLLFDVIRFTALKRNSLPLHASAFLYDGVGVLVTGWTKGGKTEALLSFANHGAQYVGDEWVILSSDGRRMFGLPMNVALWDWQFKYVPGLLPRIGLQKRVLFKSIHLLDAVHTLLGRGRLRQFYPIQLLGEALPILKHGLKIRESPQVIFKNCASKLEAPLDILFLMMSHSKPDITVEPCDPLEVARRMLSSNEHEQMRFFEHYRAFTFAFPHLQNPFLEQVDSLQSSLLSQALVGKKAYKVLHPYPVPFEALFEHLKPFCEANR